MSQLKDYIFSDDIIDLYESDPKKLITYLLEDQISDLESLRIFLINSGRKDDFTSFIGKYLYKLLEKWELLERESEFGSLLNKKINNIDSFSTRGPVEAILKKLSVSAFKDQLTEDIQNKKDILCEQYIDSFLTKFCCKYGITEHYRNRWGMRGKLKERFFPTDDFHSFRSRRLRNKINGHCFYKTYNRITEAYMKGKTDIEYLGSEKAKFDSGEYVEAAFFDELSHFLGDYFDVKRNVKVKQPNKKPHEVDIVICKKNSIFEDINEVEVNNVFAVFEVKRNLSREHLRKGNKKHTELFHTKCSELKYDAMPFDSNNLTPYQALNGKVFVGIFATDIYDKDKLLEKEFYEGLYTDLTYKQAGSEAEGYRQTLLPDFIYILNKEKELDIASIKESKFISVDSVVRHYGVLNSYKKNIDYSVSTFGCLLKEIINFFVGNGYIPKAHQLVERFKCFGAIHDELSINHGIITYFLPKHFGELNSYLYSKVPNEYSSIALDKREPLKVLKSWPRHSIPDKFYNTLKHKIKVILTHESKSNQTPAIELHSSNANVDDLVRSLLKN